MKCLLFVLMLACSAAGATVIDRYTTALDVQADGGSQASVTLELKDCQPGRLVLPVGFGGVDRFQVLAAPDGVVLKLVPGTGQLGGRHRAADGHRGIGKPALCVPRAGRPGSPESQGR
jgi:hypothetical protein